MAAAFAGTKSKRNKAYEFIEIDDSRVFASGSSTGCGHNIGMKSYQTDPKTALELCVVCPSIVVVFIMLTVFFVCPEKRPQLFPMLKEYRVKIDFNELQRIRDEAKKKTEAAQIANNENTSTAAPSETQIASNVTEQQPQEQTNETATTNNEPEDIPEADRTPNLAPADSALAFNSTPPPMPDLPPPVFTPPELPPKKGKPLKFTKATLKGVPYYQAIFDLKDPEMYLSIELANNAEEANSAQSTHGDESFPSFVKRSHAAVVQNGTFFSKDDQKRVMGNMVARGRYLKYSPWENYGTTLGIKKNNEPEMITARVDGQPDWSQHWFSMTCGPRLLRNGQVYVNGEEEGFTDSHVLGVGPRCAIGYPASKDKIYLVTFLKGLSLQKEAEVMKAMGCAEAMNLDGGASKALAHNGEVIVEAHRPLTNCLVVYDTNYPAPKPLITSWKEFQKRPDQNVALGY